MRNQVKTVRKTEKTWKSRQNPLLGIILTWGHRPWHAQGPPARGTARGPWCLPLMWWTTGPVWTGDLWSLDTHSNSQTTSTTEDTKQIQKQWRIWSASLKNNRWEQLSNCLMMHKAVTQSLISFSLCAARTRGHLCLVLSAVYTAKA